MGGALDVPPSIHEASDEEEVSDHDSIPHLIPAGFAGEDYDSDGPPGIVVTSDEEQQYQGKAKSSDDKAESSDDEDPLHFNISDMWSYKRRKQLQ